METKITVPSIKTALPGPNAKAIIDRDKTVVSPSYTRGYPLVIASGTGSSSAPGAQVNGPNNTGGPVPGLATPSATDSSTVGRAPGVNPSNPQDATRRGNPSDRTLRGAQNPQDMTTDPGAPKISKPER